MFDSSPRGEGYCNFTRKVIAIAERLDPNARLQALIHELGHALLRAEPEAAELSYAQEEIVIDSTTSQASSSSSTRSRPWRLEISTSASTPARAPDPVARPAQRT